jgi:FKBP-type peptidyl-prolyl cis-trans isomerase
MQNIQMRTWIAITAAIVVIAYVFWQGVWSPLVNNLSAQSAAVGGADTSNVNLALPGDNSQTGSVAQTGNASQQGALPNLPDNQIGVIDVTPGTGAEAKAGNTVSVQYDGYLTNGTKFDSSRVRGTPFTFTLGTGQVIPGFDRGITGMKVGGVRRIIIPPALGYGAQAQGTIPANSTLLFEVQLVSVK